MIPAKPTNNEEERLRLLEQLDILDTLEEQAYDDLTFLAAQICGAPIALVSLVDRDRQWFKSHLGLDVRETPRAYAFCAHAIHGDDIFVVEDSTRDERFHDNPLVTGKPHVIFYAGAPLVLRDALHLGTLCVIDDHARSLTQSQRQALKALARQVTLQLELRLKVRELQQLDAAKDEFISMVNHELRTPLTAIKGSLGLLDKDLGNMSVSDELKSLSSLALRNTDRLLNIVNDILDVAKLEAGRMELDLQTVVLTDLVRKAVELNEPYCQRCDCRMQLDTDVETDQDRIRGDAHRLLQVLGNLISNAAKFTTRGDTIGIHVTDLGERLQVSVTDHGPGIPSEDQALIFRRFSQLESRGNGKLPGTGLGLNISKHIIDLHGGEIGFHVQAGKQTTFYFILDKLRESRRAEEKADHQLRRRGTE